MASQKDRDEFARIAAGKSRVPVKAMPTIPDALKANPAHKAAWEQFEADQDAWRKSIDFGAGATAFAGGSAIGGGTSGGTTNVVNNITQVLDDNDDAKILAFHGL